MNIAIDEKYNNFTVLGEACKDPSNGEQRYLCVCICGAKRDVRKSNLGKIKGCGCQRKVYKQRVQSPKRNPKPRAATVQTISSKTQAKINQIKSEEKSLSEQPYQYQPNARQKLEDMRIEREARDIFEF